MDTIDRSHPAAEIVSGASAAPAPEAFRESTKPGQDKIVSAPRRSPLLRWFLNDIPYIAMLLLALVGVVLRLPVIYWVILTPVFGMISIVEGWTNFDTRSDRLGLVIGVALDWCALLCAIYLLYNSGVQGVMNANATSLGMMTLLALGTFVAGVQARVWQICAVGVALFVAVPALGWLDQSPLLLTAGVGVIIALGGGVWWVSQRHESTTS